MDVTFSMFLTTLIIAVVKREMSGTAPPVSRADICAASCRSRSGPGRRALGERASACWSSSATWPERR